MGEFIIHGVPGSPFMRAVMIGMEEKGAAYRVSPLDGRAMRGDEYRKLHPFARVPAIEHDGFALYETQAILRYIDAVFPEPALQPTDARGIARMSQAMGVNDWYLFPQVGRTIGFQRIVGPVIMGLTPDEAVIAAAVPDAQRCLGALDHMLGNAPFLAGDMFSLADIIVAPQLDYIAMTPEGRAILDGTRLQQWLTRVRERPSMVKTLPPEAFRKAA